MEHKREIIRKIVRLLRQANERDLIITLGQHRINAKNRIIQWVPNKNCE